MYGIFFGGSASVKTSEPLVLLKDISKFVMEPVQNNSAYLVRSDRDSYLVDNSDLEYYNEKRDREIVTQKRFNDELKSRGLRCVPSRREQIPIDEYLVNELIGGNFIENEVRPEVRPEVYRDTQNVHDTHVQRDLRMVYSGVKETSKEANRVFSENDIVRFASTLNKDTEKLSRVITTLKSRKGNVTNFSGDTEYTILRNTWKSGNDNVREQIINNLLDCESTTSLGDSVVCPTGTSSRIVESVFIETPELMPKTKDTLVQEMLAKAGAIRGTLEGSQEYQDLSEASQKVTLKSNILDSYYNDYKDIFSESEINEYTKEWIDNI